jgi:hypothetical protein
VVRIEPQSSAGCLLTTESTTALAMRQMRRTSPKLGTNRETNCLGQCDVAISLPNTGSRIEVYFGGGPRLHHEMVVNYKSYNSYQPCSSTTDTNLAQDHRYSLKLCSQSVHCQNLGQKIRSKSERHGRVLCCKKNRRNTII